MANDIIVSEMTSASQINTNDLMIMTQPDLQAETGYSTKKGTVLQVANKMLKGTEYLTDLPDFTDKTVLGGLEELKGDLTALLPVNTASGAIANFDTDLSLPLVDCKANIVATGGNGTPDNPNPINGYTEANIVNTQNESIVDLFSIDSDFRGTVAFNQLEVNNSSHITTSLEYNWNNIGGFFSIVNGHKYFASLVGTLVSGTVIRLRDSAQSLVLSGGNSNQIIISAPKTTSGTTFVQGKWDEGTVDAYLNVIDLTQMFGSTIANYIYSLEQATAGAGVAFFKTIYSDDYYDYDVGTNELVGKITPNATINFGQTVYGGVLDVTRGKLHVTHGATELSKDWNWRKSGSYDGAFYVFISEVPSLNAKSYEPFTCSHLQSVNDISDYIYGKCYCDAAMNFFIMPTGSSLQDFKNYIDAQALVNTPIRILYELATPFDIDLTPVQINALLGVNNVFNDTNGDTEVKYKEGIQHYIDKKIAATQALIL